MDLLSGQPYWLAKNGLTDFSHLSNKNRDTEVLVIGGGITGALMLYNLTKAGFSTVLVDKRRFGTGSTSASTALLQYQIDVPLSELQEMIGVDKANRAYKHCALAIVELLRISKEIDFKNIYARPTLFKASDIRGQQLIEKEFELHQSLGLKVELLSQKDIGNTFGFKAPGGLWSNHSAETDPFQLMDALQQWSEKKGAVLLQLTEVESLKTTEGGIEAHLSDKSTIKAKYAVYASGYEIDEKLYRDIVSLNTTFAYITEPSGSAENWHQNSLIWETAEPYHYMRSADNGSIIVGGGDIKGNDPKRRARLLNRKVVRLRKHFLKMFPHLNQPVEFQWAGTFGSTKDGLPYIGAIDGTPNVFYALGFGGNGITFSTLAGKLITQQMKGEFSAEAELYKFER